MPTGFIVSYQCRRETIRRARELRLSVTSAEASLWNALRRHQLDGVKFRRQHPIGPYIVDFFAPRFSVAVEVDGPHHERTEEKDRARQALIERHGITFVRLPAADVAVDLPGCLRRISEALWGRVPV
jgi:very-short-patch-repair endonuclease